MSNLTNIIERMIETRLGELHTCLPGKVVKVDVAKAQCDVQPLLKRTYSDGEIVSNPKWLRNKANKLAKEQRKLSKMVRCSNNYNRQRIKVAKLHEKITNQRKDFLHKLSSEIVKDNQIIA